MRSLLDRLLRVAHARWLVGLALAATTACAEASDAELSIPATDSEISLPFTLDARGRGESRIGVIELEGAVGTVEIDGATRSAFAHFQQPWPQVSRTLYQVLVVDVDRLYVLWLYCDGERLSELYAEGTTGGDAWFESSSGTCVGSDAAHVAHVALPPVSMPFPAAVSGPRIEGPDIHVVPGEHGTVTLGGRPMTLLPFAIADCSSCGDGGWHETHVLLWDEPARSLTFAILYLRPERPGAVQIEFALAIPDLRAPVYPELAAAWSLD